MTRNSLYSQELLKGHYYPQTTAYYFKEWNDFKMNFHTHDSVEIMYVITGACVVGTEQQAYHMKKGDFIFLDANVPHSLAIEKDKPSRMLNIEFTFSTGEPLLQPIKDIAAHSQSIKELLEQKSPYLLLRDSDEMHMNLKNLVMELDKGPDANRLLINLMYYELLIRLSRFAQEARINEKASGAVHVNKAVRYMQQHLGSSIKAADIAATVNVHPVYLHRVFKANTGSTLMDYLTSLRMEKSKTLLANTDISIIDISSIVGISSRQHFTTLFKKYFAMTPAGYRRSINIENN